MISYATFSHYLARIVETIEFIKLFGYQPTMTEEVGAFIPAAMARVNPFTEPDISGRSPLVLIHRSRKQLRKKAPNSSSEVHYKNEIRLFLERQQEAGACVDKKHAERDSNCACVFDLEVSEEEATNIEAYLYSFALLERTEQQTLIIEWIKYGENIGRGLMRGDPRRLMKYLLPGTQRLICKEALTLLLGYGQVAWQTVETMAKKNVAPQHGNTGLQNAKNIWQEVALEEFFKELLLQAHPRATVVIRDLVQGRVQTELRNEGDQVDLPAHMSKRGLYAKLVSEMGWIFEYDSKGTLIGKKQIVGHATIIGESDIPSWGSFRDYWKKNFPELVVGARIKDICNDCYIFANQHRYAKNKRDASEIANEETEGAVENAEDQATQDIDDMLQSEKLVTDAAIHVDFAQRQRELYRLKRAEAMATKDLPPSERVLTFVADFAQNMGIPNFAGEQPGATYYYSPLTAHIFGIVDASIDKLSAYIYTEDVAKKGGNIVASLLMHHLEAFTATTEPFKEINIVMDNCGGQNKNQHVLRLLNILVKRQLATTAKLIFLIRGHTKNDCDRLFNTMKMVYRKSDVFTPQDLVDCMQHEKVEPIMVPPEAFVDWNGLENSFIDPPSGHIQANHIFQVDINVDNGNSMVIQIADHEPTVVIQLVKSDYRLHPTQFWKDQTPATIAPPGIQDIKWQELYFKWGAYVPQLKKQQWCYYIDKPPQEKIAKVRGANKVSRKQRQTRTRTVHQPGGDGAATSTEEPATATTMAHPPTATSTTNNKRKAPPVPTVDADGQPIAKKKRGRPRKNAVAPTVEPPANDDPPPANKEVQQQTGIL
jgi:hypothetical protein